MLISQNYKTSKLSFKGGLKQNTEIGYRALHAFYHNFPKIQSSTRLNRQYCKLANAKAEQQTEEFIKKLDMPEGPEREKTIRRQLNANRIVQILKYSQGEKDEKVQKVNNVLAFFIRKKRNEKHYFLDEISWLKRQMKKYNVANCGEMSEVVYHDLKKQGHKPVRIYFPRSTHSFVLIGAKENADFRKPKTWGNKAVVIDPWNKFVLPAREAMQVCQGSCEAMEVSNKPSVIKQLFQRVGLFKGE